MAVSEDHPRPGVNRRDALRLLAASATTVTAGSMIVSRPAHAASGSEPCAYDGTPGVTVRMVNRSGNRSDYLGVSVAVGGSCPCGNGFADVRYAYSITIPGTGTGALGWSSSSSVFVASPAILWPNAGGTVTVAVGVQVTCPDKGGGTVVSCRFGSATFTVLGPNSDTTQTFSLSGATPPAGSSLPACGPATFARSAPLLASNGLALVSGLGTVPVTDRSQDQAVVDLGTPAGDTTTTTTTTTTTDKPGNGPKKPSTTTTSPPTTTPPTSAPPSTAPPPASTTAPPTSTTQPPG